MNAEAVVQRAQDLGIALTVDGNRILYAPKSKAPDDLVAALRAHKPAVIEYLQQHVVLWDASAQQALLAWATDIAERGITLDQPVEFIEAPLRRVTTIRVGFHARLYLTNIVRARLYQRTGGLGARKPDWWHHVETENLEALASLQRAMSERLA